MGISDYMSTFGAAPLYRPVMLSRTSGSRTRTRTRTCKLVLEDNDKDFKPGPSTQVVETGLYSRAKTLGYSEEWLT